MTLWRWAILAVVVVLGVLFYMKLNRVAGQVGDVTGLATHQAARVDRLLGEQTAVLARAVASQRALLTSLDATSSRTQRDVHRVLARFQLLFRRVLRALRTRLPEQTQTLVRSIERGLRQLLRGIPKRR